MKDERYKSWDIIFKALAPVVTVAGLLLGLHQFQRSQENVFRVEQLRLEKNDAIAFRRALWEKQRDIYTNLGNVIGEILASSEDPTAFRTAVRKFYVLYWGDMILIADDTVRSRMIDFHRDLRDHGLKRIETDQLKPSAEQLIESCRKSLENYQSAAQPRGSAP